MQVTGLTQPRPISRPHASRCGREDGNVALLTRPHWLFPTARQIGSEKEELIGGNDSAFQTV